MSQLEKQRGLLDFALSSLWRRKGKNGALILVYGLVVFMLASVMLFAKSLREEAKSALAETPEIVVQRMVAGRHDLIPVGYAQAVRAVRGVSSVEPRLWGYYFHKAAGATFTVLAQPDFPHGDDAAVVGAGVWRVWDEAAGREDSKLWFKAFDGSPLVLAVAEIMPEMTELVASDLIVVSETCFRRLFGIPETLATDLAVRVGNEREAATAAEKIAHLLPGTRPILRAETLRTYAALFDWRGGYLAAILGSAALAFLVFAWDRATGLSAEERAEIGLLKAVGWDTGDVLALKLWEGAVVSLSSFGLGLTGAWLHVFMGRAVLFESALRGWSAIFPRHAPAPVVDPLQIGALFFLTVVPYALVTMLPAWRAATTDPDSVMRQV